ncbi:MAG TPA: CRISPR-associated helicase Cas3', partial [Nitrososphaera sp.]
VFSYKQREYASLLRGLMMSADHIASASTNYMPPNIPRLSDYNVNSYQLYGFQERTSKATGNLILRAPTGSGKTEAALLWAQLNQRHNGRLFYALPTTASINAMYLRLSRIFPKDLVGLLHSRATSVLYSMFEQDGKGESLANQRDARTIGSLVREMYYPIRVCTPHQILRYSLQGKGWEQMLSEFPHSVFIFDEIHAYNPKLTGLTMATVRYLISHKARVMFLTATLPTFIRRLIEKGVPGIPFIEPSYTNAGDRKILEQKRHTVEPIPGNIIDNLEKTISKIGAAESNLIVCNHVPTAQQVYKELSKRVKDTQLLHARFTRRDRNRIENSLAKRIPRVLVSTQVVEVSLDLSFKQMFTEPAPIDALVQRMGRVNRRPKPEDKPAKVYIFTKQLRDTSKPYTEQLRDDSLKVITSPPMPLSEEDLNDAADKVYGNGYNIDDQREYNDGLNYEKLKEFKRFLIAGTSQDWIEQVIEDQEGTIELLPEQLLDEYNDLREQGLTIPANDLLVPVSRRRISGLIEDGRLDIEQDPWLLKDCRYSEKIGLELDK